MEGTAIGVTAFPLPSHLIEALTMLRELPRHLRFFSSQDPEAA